MTGLPSLCVPLKVVQDDARRFGIVASSKAALQKSKEWKCGRLYVPYLTSDEGIKLYYEDSGAGQSILFIDAFAGD
jgi:hypothetical protein